MLRCRIQFILCILLFSISKSPSFGNFVPFSFYSFHSIHIDVKMDNYFLLNLNGFLPQTSSLVSNFNFQIRPFINKIQEIVRKSSIICLIEKEKEKTKFISKFFSFLFISSSFLLLCFSLFVHLYSFFIIHNRLKLQI